MPILHGARKSSVGGAIFADAGQELFNPDLAAQEFLLESPEISQEEGTSELGKKGDVSLKSPSLRGGTLPCSIHGALT